MTGDWRLIDERTGRVVVADLHLAHRFWQRLAGWQFRARPGAGQGLLLLPCSSIHTFWMRFSIDVVGIGASGRVTAIICDLRPWRLASLPSGTLAVLEMPAGAAAQLEIGAELRLAASSAKLLPAKMQRLFAPVVREL